MSKANNEKSKNEKSEELYTIHKVFKSLASCSAVVLRNKLEIQFPETWANTGNDHRSDERRIKRALDKLLEFGLATKEKIGKDQIYAYIHDDNKLGKVHKIAETLNVNFDNMTSYYKRRSSIVSLLNDVSDIYYIQNQQEDINNKEKIIKALESAIEKRQNITITHKGNQYKTSPLKIVQFDGFWYFISYSTKYFKYRIKDISDIQTTQETYNKSIAEELKLDEWQNIWHTPNTQATKVIILIDNSIFHYFKEKNILGVNTHKSRLTPCQDGMEYELYITHAWELLPTLMQWQKHVSIASDNGDIDIIGIYKKILHDIKI